VTAGWQYVNVALNQPVIVSSLNSGQYASAVDGNTDTSWDRGSCLEVSANDNNTAWLTVDLGALTYVYGINFTNRGNCCGMSQMLVKVGTI
jgi:hypothetical protein